MRSHKNYSSAALLKMFVERHKLGVYAVVLGQHTSKVIGYLYVAAEVAHQYHIQGPKREHSPTISDQEFTDFLPHTQQR